MREIEKNFRFLLKEVERQVDGVQAVLDCPDEAVIARIEGRDDYIDNLKSVIENACYARIHGEKGLGSAAVAWLRAVITMTANLEHIGDHAVNTVRQTRYLEDPDVLARFDYRACVDEVRRALALVPGAAFDRDMAKALSICKAELALDERYLAEFTRLLTLLRERKRTGDLLTTLFIFRYLERMGDALLNIGEAAIFGITGDKFKIRQFNALSDALAAAGQRNPLTDVEFESIWGTRSGCRIARLHERQPGEAGAVDVIFKDGDSDKLKSEAGNIARFEALMPGLPPKVAAFRTHKKSATLLVEALSGRTLQDIALDGDEAEAGKAVAALAGTSAHLWAATRRKKPARGSFIAQVRQRLPEVLSVHPRFDFPAWGIGTVRHRSLSEILDAAEALEAALPAPFTVFVHGDFNANNIIYDTANDRIHYIDLHRAADADLVQDVSVFMISCFRLPVFTAPRRRILWGMMTAYYAFARDFTKSFGDDTFEARLALGLARSCITSTRFELTERFAKLMLLRGVYLLTAVTGFAGEPAAFTLPLRAVAY